ncbi:MAG: hypothetical protein ACRC9L_02980, partial [Brevinema sp.]
TFTGSGNIENKRNVNVNEDGEVVSFDQNKPKEMHRTLLRYSEKCMDDKTIYFQYNKDVDTDFGVSCSGDSGSGVMRIHPVTGKQQLVGVIRSSSALAGDCVHNDAYQDLDPIEAQATRLTEETIEFIKINLPKNKGIPRWNNNN